MSQYKVTDVFELEGVMQPVDSVVELSEEVAAPFVAEGKLAAVEAPVETPAAADAPEATPEATPEVATEGDAPAPEVEG